jgi:hypothetical protein
VDNDAVWGLVEIAKKTAGDDSEARIEALGDVLANLTPAQLQSFQQHYDRKIVESYNCNLWGTAYVSMADVRITDFAIFGID